MSSQFPKHIKGTVLTTRRKTINVTDMDRWRASRWLRYELRLIPRNVRIALSPRGSEIAPFTISGVATNMRAGDRYISSQNIMANHITIRHVWLYPCVVTIFESIPGIRHPAKFSGCSRKLFLSLGLIT